MIRQAERAEKAEKGLGARFTLRTNCGITVQKVFSQVAAIPFFSAYSATYFAPKSLSGRFFRFIRFFSISIHDEFAQAV